ncbi:MAG: DUF554 domain-containing protein [Bacteroidaceae bacterium]|nr:DUF554 domain-containing protein [Bacteroidaceae bacterium]
MLGTIVNTCAILAGSAFGALVRTGIGEKYKKTLFDGLGLCCLVLGMNASLPNMSKSEYPVLFILSLAIGGLIGTRLNLAGRIERFNAKTPSVSPLKGKKPAAKEALPLREGLGGSGGPAGSVQGLVTGCLLYCIGTFSIVGPVLSALSPTAGWSWGEPANTFLYTNATLDFVSSAVLAASYGWIMLLAAPILFCWQGLFYAIGYFCGDGMPEPMRVELSIVGGVLILSSGLSILGIKDCKTVNLLPSLLVPVVFYLIKSL